MEPDRTSVQDDLFARAIRYAIGNHSPRNILSIEDGENVHGGEITESPTFKMLCEVDKPVHQTLKDKVAHDIYSLYVKEHDFKKVKVYHTPPTLQKITEDDVWKAFHQKPGWKLWKQIGVHGTINLLKSQHIDQDALTIKGIKKKARVRNFGLVIIHRDVFQGKTILKDVVGSKLIALNGIRDLSNNENYKRLMELDYSLEWVDFKSGVGYAIFKKL